MEIIKSNEDLSLKKSLDDKKHVLNNLSNDKRSFFIVSSRLKNDKEVVLEFIRNYKLKYIFGEEEVDFNSNFIDSYDLYWFLKYLSEEMRNDKDVLNELRRFLLNDDYGSVSYDEDGLFLKAKENLIKYDGEDRGKELKLKLEEVKPTTSLKPERTGRKKI